MKPNKLPAALAACEGQVCYIGSGSGFFYVGYPGDECEKALDALSEYYKQNLDATLSSNECKYDLALRERNFLRRLHKKRPKSEGIAEELELSEKECDMLAQKTAALRKAKARFTPFIERNVLAVYDRKIDPPLGKIIKISGDEAGFAWDMREYQKGMRKIERQHH